MKELTCLLQIDNTTRFLLLETSKEETKYKVVEGKAELIRAMVRIETSATSNALSEFISELSISEMSCHTRSIERRAKKDAVDVVDMSTILDEGHWPFVYLIEVEARKSNYSNGHEVNRSASRASKRASKDGDEEALDFAATFYGVLHTAMACARESQGSESSAILLGMWS
jgi:prephenate dehydratase